MGRVPIRAAYRKEGDLIGHGAKRVEHAKDELAIC